MAGPILLKARYAQSRTFLLKKKAKREIRNAAIVR
jgi:hypothetical protein